MKKLITSLALAATTTVAVGQSLPNRYLSETSSGFTLTKDVTFSTNIPTIRTTNLFGVQFANEDSYGERTVTLKMDIYRPASDTATKRPVLIFCFGGGFVTGSRTEASMQRLCESFARRGFVTATIDYRLGMNLTNKELAKRAVYRGLQDVRSAVRFFRKNAATYGVDANQILVSGHSAGAFAALHNVYLDKESERPASTFNYMGRADLGTLDAIGDNKTFSNGNPVSGKANGVMAFAGAVGELAYIEGAADVAGVYFHSSDDNTVPYNSGEPFSFLSWIPGLNLPTVYGGNQMNNRAAAVGATRTFYPYTNRGHGVHFDSPTLYNDIAPRGGQFFYDQRLKPSTTSISGPTSLCNNALTQTYTLANTSSFYRDWQIVGGSFINRNPYSNSVTVSWNATASVRSLSVTPYSRQLARGTSNSISVAINCAPRLLASSSRILDFSENIDFNTLFTDPDGESTLTYTLETPLNATLSSEDKKLSVANNADENMHIKVTATDEAGCSVSQTFEVRKYTLPQSSEAFISFAPNSVIEKTTLSMDGSYTGKVQIIVQDGLGNVVHQSSLEKNRDTAVQQINLGHLKRGIYFCKVITSEKTFSKKIVKE